MIQGYALVEYSSFEEASETIKKLNGEEILGQAVSADWAFTTK
jgi:RNA recognition motif-containing protein